MCLKCGLAARWLVRTGLLKNGMHDHFPEKRSHQRHRVYVRGEIRSSRWISTRCSVHDVTAEGARLVVSPIARLPEYLRLRVAMWNLEVNAKVVWREGEQVGIQFIDPPERFKLVVAKVERNRQPARMFIRAFRRPQL